MIRREAGDRFPRSVPPGASGHGRPGSGRRFFPPRPSRAGRKLLLLLVPLLWVTGCSRKEEAQQSALAYRELDAAFQPLRSDFENESGKVRIVALLSPSCGHCLDNADAVATQVLNRIDSEDLVVFLVWASTSPMDVAPKAERIAGEYSQDRITNYWDNSGRIARAFGRRLGAPPGTAAWDVFFIYGRDATWDPEGKMDQEPPEMDASRAGWMPGAPRYPMGEHKAIDIPNFNWATMVELTRKLLAETEGRAPDAGGESR